MKQKRLPALLATLPCIALPAVARGVINPANGNEYFLTPNVSTFFEARAYAASLGGHLVSITDAQEQAFVVQHFALPGEVIWIGLSDELVEGDWRWDSGETFSFSAWGPGEPNNNPQSNPDGEDYGVLWYPFGHQWNDLPGDYTTYFPGQPPTLEQHFGIVELVPSPSMSGLMLCAALFAGTRRRRSV